MMSYSRPVAVLVCFAAVLSSALASDVSTSTKTVTKTTTKGHTTTLTSAVVASDATIIYGDNTDAGYPYPTDVSTLTVTSTPSSTFTSTITTQSETTVPGTATYTAPVYGFSEQPIQDSLPSAAYYYKKGGADPIAKKLKAREAEPAKPCTTVTTTLTKYKTVQKTSTKTTASTITGTYITWLSESSGIPASEYTSPKYTTTKTVSTIENGFDYFETTVTTTIPGTSTLLSTTTTVYQACATNNFADSIALPDGTHPTIDGISSNATNFKYNGPIPDTPTAYDCCVKALYGDDSRTTAAWLFQPFNSECYYYTDDISVVCEETTEQADKLTAYYGDTQTSPGAVFGNGLCGKVIQYQYHLDG